MDCDKDQYNTDTDVSHFERPISDDSNFSHDKTKKFRLWSWRRQLDASLLVDVFSLSSSQCFINSSQSIFNALQTPSRPDQCVFDNTWKVKFYFLPRHPVNEYHLVVENDKKLLRTMLLRSRLSLQLLVECSRTKFSDEHCNEYTAVGVTSRILVCSPAYSPHVMEVYTLWCRIYWVRTPVTALNNSCALWPAFGKKQRNLCISGNGKALLHCM